MAMAEDAAPASAKFKFGFTKKLETKVKSIPINRAINSEAIEVKKTVEFITTFEDRQIISQNGVHVPTGELIIPLIRKNKWAIKATPTSLTMKEEVTTNTEDANAAAEILKDVEKLQKSVAESDDNSLEIPLWMLNRLPAGADGADDKLNVEMHAEESTLDDYEQIPVEKYGLAMLRGMGWKADEGIGKTNKQVTKPLEINIRPRGLGLGAVPIKEKKKEMQKDAEEKAEKKVIVGSFVQIVQGREQGRVGKVTSAGQGAERWTIQLVGEEKRLVSILEACLTEITEKEHSKAGKYLNNDKYHEHKLMQDAKLSRIRQEVHEEEDRRAKRKEEKVRVKKEPLSEEEGQGGAVIWEELGRRKEDRREDRERRKEKERNGRSDRRKRSHSRSRTPERRRRK